MKKLLALTVVAALPLLAAAQSPQPSGSLFAGLQNVFDVNNTNSLLNASEINLTPEFKWNSASQKAGAALNADWWVTDQQGAMFGYEEYDGRDSYFTLGYQARTVFNGIEVSFGLGTRQSNTDPFGDVKMFIRPTITKKIWGNDNWDIRLMIGCDVLNIGKPNPFAGVTFRALRF